MPLVRECPICLYGVEHGSDHDKRCPLYGNIVWEDADLKVPQWRVEEWIENLKYCDAWPVKCIVAEMKKALERRCGACGQKHYWNGLCEKAAACPSCGQDGIDKNRCEHC